MWFIILLKLPSSKLSESYRKCFAIISNRNPVIAMATHHTDTYFTKTPGYIFFICIVDALYLCIHVKLCIFF
jgi:hypothetical protein